MVRKNKRKPKKTKKKTKRKTTKKGKGLSRNQKIALAALSVPLAMSNFNNISGMIGSNLRYLNGNIIRDLRKPF